jgi:hypothetical protein
VRKLPSGSDSAGCVQKSGGFAVRLKLLLHNFLKIKNRKSPDAGLRWVVSENQDAGPGFFAADFCP